MGFTDNPLKDADRYDQKQQAWLDTRPICYGCGEPIQEDYCLGFRGHKYHTDCILEWARDAAPEFTEVTSSEFI